MNYESGLQPLWMQPQYSRHASVTAHTSVEAILSLQKWHHSNSEKHTAKDFFHKPVFQIKRAQKVKDVRKQ